LLAAAVKDSDSSSDSGYDESSNPSSAPSSSTDATTTTTTAATAAAVAAATTNQIRGNEISANQTRPAVIQSPISSKQVIVAAQQATITNEAIN
jgi:hypothetical protein